MCFCVLCIVCFVTFPVLFVCICVLNNCHRVATQLQLNNIHHIIYQIHYYSYYYYYHRRNMVKGGTGGGKGEYRPAILFLT